MPNISVLPKTAQPAQTAKNSLFSMFPILCTNLWLLVIKSRQQVKRKLWMFFALPPSRNCQINKIYVFIAHLQYENVNWTDEIHKKGTCALH